jgi:hypothetical protein
VGALVKYNHLAINEYSRCASSEWESRDDQRERDESKGATGARTSDSEAAANVLCGGPRESEGSECVL